MSEIKIFSKHGYAIAKPMTCVDIEKESIPLADMEQSKVQGDSDNAE